MRRQLTHDLRRAHEQTVEHRSTAYLAIVDLDSYPTFAAEQADYLDILQHLCRQSQALTAVMWETPKKSLQIKFLLTENHFPSHDLAQDGHQVVFSGWVRTDGRLCLVSNDRLLDSGRNRARDLFNSRRLPEEYRSRLLLVPSGLYAVNIFAGLPPHHFDGPETVTPDYTVVLRHYPHPAPRIAPVRLGSLVPWAA